MSVADASAPSSVTLLSAKKRHSIQLYPTSDPQTPSESVLEKIQHVFTPQTRRKRSQELTSPVLAPSSRSHSPDGGEFTFALSRVPSDPRLTAGALIRDISLEEELQSKVLQLTQEVAMLKIKCKGQRKENHTLSQSLEVYKQECSAVVTSLREVYNTKMEELQKALTRTTKARDDIHNEKTALEAAFKQMLDLSEKDRKSLKTELGETREQCSQAHKSLTKIELKLASVEKANSVLVQENADLKRELETLKWQKQADLSKMGYRLQETEMRNGFYQMLFEVAVNKVKYVEERQLQQQQQQQQQQRDDVYSPESNQSFPEVYSPSSSSSKDRFTPLPRTPSHELLQTLYDGLIWNTDSHKSFDSQSMESSPSDGDSDAQESLTTEAMVSDSKELEVEFPSPVRSFVRGHSEPNILSPFLFGSSSEMPKFDFNSQNESDESCSTLSASSSSRFSADQQNESPGAPEETSLNRPTVVPGRRGRLGRRAPLLKSYTVDDERVIPRLKFRTNTNPNEEEIVVDNDYVIVDSSMNILRDNNDVDEEEEGVGEGDGGEEGEEEDYSHINNRRRAWQDQISPRSGFQMLKQRRNGITDMPQLPALVFKSKKSKGRELADIFRKLTSGSHGDGEKKTRKLSRKRSKSVKN